MRCEQLEGAGRAPEKWRLCARIENEREGDHGHGAQFRREGVPGFQTHYPVTMDTSNAARASNLKYGFRRFSPPELLFVVGCLLPRDAPGGDR